MSEPPDDDAQADRLLSGSGKDVDPEVAEFLDLVRSTHRAEPVPSAALERFIAAPTAPALRTRVRTRLRRTSVVARSGAVAVTALIATGSLAMAHALPAPAQDFASHLGVGRPARHSHHDTPDPAPTTGPIGGVVPPGTESRSTTGSTPTTGAGAHAGTGPKAADANSPSTGAPATGTTLAPAAGAGAGADRTTVVPTTTTVPQHTNNGVGTGNATNPGNANGVGKGNSNGVGNGNATNPGNGNAANPGNGNASGAANANANAGTNGKAKGH